MVDLDKRAEKDKMEEAQRQENMDWLHVDMQKSKGGDCGVEHWAEERRSRGRRR